MNLTNNPAFNRAYKFEYLTALAEIERRADCGDLYPIATQIGALIHRRDRYLAEGLVHDADIISDVIDALEERV